MIWPFGDPTPVLHPPGLILRAPKLNDFAQWRQVRAESFAFLKPFEPRWREADLVRDVFQGRIRHSRAEARKGTEFTFFILSEDEEKILGGLTLSNVRRRVSLHANMGYWMSHDNAGQGIMTRAVAGVLPFVFDDLKLHRLHAACLPNNSPSRRVLEKSGFKEEGFAEHYLKIDGAWRDHVLYGLTLERYRVMQAKARKSQRL